MSSLFHHESFDRKTITLQIILQESEYEIEEIYQLQEWYPPGMILNVKMFFFFILILDCSFKSPNMVTELLIN